jgi:predicted AlkP superfamily pyrophosphatase or phosphodiesterase
VGWTIERKKTLSYATVASRLGIVGIVTFTAVMEGCVQPPFTIAPVTRDTPEGAVTNHVVVVSVDGLRPDAIARFGAVTMQRLMRTGSYTLDARTITLSKTLPSHTSMLTGELPEEHGIVWNSDETDTHGTIQIPTIFSVARQHGFHTAAFFSKAKFNHLEPEGTLDHTQAPNGRRWSADRTVGDVEQYLVTQRPNLLFVHIGEPDYAGHLLGWMSWWYARAVRSADAAVSRIVAAADRAYGVGNYTLILTADHGGHGRTHGTDAPEDVTIPWVAHGRGVREGVTLSSGIRTVDTAATVLWLLGLAPTTEWTGVPVRAAFTDEAQATADAARLHPTP